PSKNNYLLANLGISRLLSTYIPLPWIPTQFRNVALHGKQPQHAREKSLKAFSEALLPIIILASDVAAHGLDILQVNLIIQEPPSDSKRFLHRSGRLAVTFLLLGEAFLALRNIHINPLTGPHLTVDDDEARRICGRIRNRSLHARQSTASKHTL